MDMGNTKQMSVKKKVNSYADINNHLCWLQICLIWTYKMSLQGNPPGISGRRRKWRKSDIIKLRTGCSISTTFHIEDRMVTLDQDGGMRKRSQQKVHPHCTLNHRFISAQIFFSKYSVQKLMTPYLCWFTSHLWLPEKYSCLDTPHSTLPFFNLIFLLSVQTYRFTISAYFFLLLCPSDGIQNIGPVHYSSDQCILYTP